LDSIIFLLVSFWYISLLFRPLVSDIGVKLFDVIRSYVAPVFLSCPSIHKLNWGGLQLFRSNRKHFVGDQVIPAFVNHMQETITLVFI
jgi:hypothetical protein